MTHYSQVIRTLFKELGFNFSMKESASKKTTGKKDFYLPIICGLESSTNLSKIQKDLGISKQQLNYYLRQLKKRGVIKHKAKGYYEVIKSSKKTTKYGSLFVKDSSRGHAYVWNVNLPKEIENWDKRIEILSKKGINFKLVGALNTTPRIKVLGRKVWLCNNHLRIFDIEKASYYGKTAKESKRNATLELFRIINTLENKLGFIFKPFEFSVQKEHYALIKNDLAIEHNKKGIILRIKDESGEWLLIDDSLGQGGELETVGKKAYKTNIPMQKWWNNHKETDFKVTPNAILSSFEETSQVLGQTAQQIQQVVENQVVFDKNISLHQEVLGEIRDAIKELKNERKNKRKFRFRLFSRF